MTESRYAIETRELVKEYHGGVRALDGVTIRIRRGDIVGYLGPNGAGKTTTIKVLTNLLRPTSGQAFINGIDVNRYPKEALRKVGALIEVPGIYEYLTPRQMLSYFGRVHGMKDEDIRRRTQEAMAAVKLSDWTDAKLGSFSTGMQRRFAIAKAILHEPRILILDEPVLGLDPKGIKDVREMLKRFRDRGMTIFLSSHLLSEVSETCDTVIFMDKGRIKAVDTVENIEHRIKLRTIDVTFLRPLDADQMARMRAIADVEGVEAVNEHYRLHFDGDPETGRRILSGLVAGGFEVVSFAPRSMGLEDYYVSIMGDERGVA
jgi:ABC-2 type transport system ATP-binding protein